MLRKEDRDKIKELLGKIECPSDFKCAASGFRYMCEAKNNEARCEILCLADDPEQCVFSEPFGDDFRCECPLRRYVCEKLGL